MTKKFRLNRGILIAIEGIDGAGKTTQVARLKEHFNGLGFKVSTFKEPTDGQYGQKIKELAKNGREHISPQKEFELFLKDREEDCKKNIGPALARNELVIIDRYYFSSIAYQGVLGLDRNYIKQENEKIAIIPDIVIILDCAVKIGLSRIRHMRKEEPNHFEGKIYLERVREIFQSMKASYIQLIDSSVDEETLFIHVRNIVQDIIVPFAYQVTDQMDLFANYTSKDTLVFTNN